MVSFVLSINDKNSPSLINSSVDTDFPTGKNIFWTGLMIRFKPSPFDERYFSLSWFPSFTFENANNVQTLTGNFGDKKPANLNLLLNTPKQKRVK